MAEIKDITPLPLIRPINPRDSKKERGQRDDQDKDEGKKPRPDGGDDSPLIDEYV